MSTFPGLYCNSVNCPNESNQLNYGKIGNCIFPKTNPHHQKQQHFYNFTIPRTILQQDSIPMPQLEGNYPSYPYHLGVCEIHPPLGVLSTKSGVYKYKKSSNNNIPKRVAVKRKLAVNNLRTSSIFKDYKSCPVSPVHEETEWSSSEFKSTNISETKRHSVYTNNTRNSFDMINSDTEKMIAEITEKYSDLGANNVNITDRRKKCIQHPHIVLSKSMPENLISSCNSSPCNSFGRNLSPLRIQSLPYVAVAPKHSFSEFYVLNDIYQGERNVSLSDILKDGATDNSKSINLAKRRQTDDIGCPEARHFSASYFLSSNHHTNNDRSNESLLYEHLIDDGSYGNSMESILSDESECVSAPLEMQMVSKEHVSQQNELRNLITHSSNDHGLDGLTYQLSCHTNGYSPHSYGSNFNGNKSYLDVGVVLSKNSYPCYTFDISNYNIEKMRKENKGTVTVVKSSMLESLARTPTISDEENIFRFNAKNKQYGTAINKSISSEVVLFQKELKEFTLKHRNMEKTKLFPKEEIFKKSSIPEQHKLISMLTSTIEEENKKRLTSRELPPSMTFISPINSSSPEKLVKKPFQQCISRGALTIENVSTGYKRDYDIPSCLKKISKFNSTSKERLYDANLKESQRISVRFNAISQINYTSVDQHVADKPSANTITITVPTGSDKSSNVMERELSENSNCKISSTAIRKQRDDGKRTFEIFINENDNNAKEYNLSEVVLNLRSNHQNNGDKKSDLMPKKHHTNMTKCSTITNNFPSTPSTIRQCENIVQKIDLIQRLITMEDTKLEQIRADTESRMRPFKCDSKRKGYVKSLTMNFDMLAQDIKKDIQKEQRRKVGKSNHAAQLPSLTYPKLTAGDVDDLYTHALHTNRIRSLPDVLDNANSDQSNKFNVNIVTSKGNDHSRQGGSILQIDTDGVIVELAKEVKEDFYTEKDVESEKLSYTGH